jgi:hypothetical protein
LSPDVVCMDLLLVAVALPLHIGTGLGILVAVLSEVRNGWTRGANDVVWSKRFRHDKAFLDKLPLSTMGVCFSAFREIDLETSDARRIIIIIITMVALDDSFDVGCRSYVSVSLLRLLLSAVRPDPFGFLFLSQRHNLPIESEKMDESSTT